MEHLKNTKLIITDLDGTILSHGQVANQNDLKVLKELNENEIGLTIATGQPWSGAVPRAKWFEIEKNINYIICNNGAYISKVSEYDPICVYEIEQDIVKKVYDKCTKMGITWLTFYRENQHAYWNGIELVCKSMNDRKWTEKYILDDISDQENFKFDMPMQMMIFIPLEKELEFSEWYIKEGLESKLASLRNTIESVPIYEFVHPEASKGNAIKNLAKILNTNLNDIVVFGDNTNDISMFEMIPNSVVMKNGPEEVKKFAKYETDTHLNGGVSQFIEKYIIGDKNGN